LQLLPRQDNIFGIGRLDMSYRWLMPQAHHSAVLFVVMAICGALTAWNSFSLIHLAMENIRFLRMFGGIAVMEGGLLQLVEIIVYGILSLTFYLGLRSARSSSCRAGEAPPRSRARHQQIADRRGLLQRRIGLAFLRSTCKRTARWV
jgi:hypothetical protein